MFVHESYDCGTGMGAYPDMHRSESTQYSKMHGAYILGKVLVHVIPLQC